MGFWANSLLRLKKYLLLVLGVIRRAMCCRRSRRNSEMLLPITVQVTGHRQEDDSRRASGTTSPGDHGNHSTGYSSWNSWGGPAGGLSSPPGEEGEEHEADYFKDMMPRIKKQKKVLISQKEKQLESDLRDSRFGVDLKATIISSTELGVIEESNYCGSWEEEAEVGDIDATLRDARQAERQRRLAEHQRIKMEKDSKRLRGQKSSLVATKLS